MADLRREQSRLRRASNTLLGDLELLQALEVEKRGIPPGDPRFQELARQIEKLAEHVLSASSTEREAGAELGGAEGSAAARTPIEETPPRPAQEILAEWREAERRLAAAADGSLDAAVARKDTDRLRDEYRLASVLRTAAPGRPGAGSGS